MVSNVTVGGKCSLLLESFLLIAKRCQGWPSIPSYSTLAHDRLRSLRRSWYSMFLHGEFNFLYKLVDLWYCNWFLWPCLCRHSSCFYQCWCCSPASLPPRLHVSIAVLVHVCRFAADTRCMALLVGSILMLVSVALLRGPWAHAKHMMSLERLPFTAAYLGTMALTLYFSIGVSIAEDLCRSHWLNNVLMVDVLDRLEIMFWPLSALYSKSSPFSGT